MPEIEDEQPDSTGTGRPKPMIPIGGGLRPDIGGTVVPNIPDPGEGDDEGEGGDDSGEDGGN